MTHQTQTTALDQITELLAERGFDGIAQAVTVLLNEVMKIERSPPSGPPPTSGPRAAPATQTATTRRRSTPGSGPWPSRSPRPGGSSSTPPPWRTGVRSERALKLAVAEMYVQDVSTRKVAAITEKLCGLEVTSAEVSRAAAALDDELEKWRTRPLGETPYLILDARYEHVRHGGSVVPCAVLVAIGIDPKGKRSILGVSASLSEAEVRWRDFLIGLQAARDLHGVRLIVSDAQAGLKPALAARCRDSDIRAIHPVDSRSAFTSAKAWRSSSGHGTPASASSLARRPHRSRHAIDQRGSSLVNVRRSTLLTRLAA